LINCATRSELSSGHYSPSLLWNSIQRWTNQRRNSAIGGPIATRKRKMGADSNCLARCTKCFTERDFDRGHVRVHCWRRRPRLTSVCDYRILWLVAAGGAQLRLTGNMLDGMVALASGRASKVGELYNEIPDRVSDAAVFIGAGFAWVETLPSVISRQS